MKKAMMGLIVAVGVFFLLFVAGCGKQQQSDPGKSSEQVKYPTKPVQLIVPFSPGGATDLGGRIIASALQEKWGVPVSVVNKSGGNTVPALNEMMNAAPDGYTIFIDNQPASSMLEVVVKDLPFKVTDRTFMAMATLSPMVIIVPSTSPWKTLGEAIEAAKKDPPNITWTSLGGVGAQDYTARQFFKVAGVDVKNTKAVMLQGGSQAVTSTAGGHVKMGVGTTSGALPSIAAGTIRPLAVTSPQRYPGLPDVPTTAELGYPSINCLYWIGFSGPPKLPSAIVDKWNKDIKEILEDPKVISQLEKVGSIPFYKVPNEMKDFVLKEKMDVQELWSAGK